MAGQDGGDARFEAITRLEEVLSSLHARDVATLGFIALERVAQNKKWGTQDHGDLMWFCILMEEVGEVAKVLYENPHQVALREGSLVVEVTQTAAVAAAWLEAILRRREARYGHGPDRHSERGGEGLGR